MEQTLWLAIALPGWPIRRLIKDGLASPDQAFATVTSHAGQRRLETLSSRAAQAGLKVGQSLSQARAILPGLLSFPATPAEDAQALTRLGLWCQAYSPLVAVEPPDMILLDMTGALHLHGTRQALLAGLAARLPGAQLALAGNAARARAFARFGVSEPVDEVAALAALPLASLGLNERVEAALRRLGVRRVGQFMRLDRGELTARFGTAPVRLLDQAMGRLTEILRFLSAPPDWRESRHYPEPLLHAEALLHALGVLAHILCTRLGEAGLGLRLLQAQFFRADAQMVTFDIGFAAAMRDEIRLARLMAGKIETIDPGFGIERICLAALEVAPLRERQSGLDGADDSNRTAALIDNLSNRLGVGKIWRIAPAPSHVPERAVMKQGPLDQPVWPVCEKPRPIRLLSAPQRIEVVAPVPDHPPVLFRWRGAVHRVRAATGPERIAREWWRHEPSAERPEAEYLRDYYQLETEAGQRFWVFRTGLHGFAAAPRWFLHGWFS
ncbi:MAG: hypothetical protein B7Z78_07065 [Rhodospirillales bacterium 20-60-12]|nr:MAG: hypothetical protein B7Z78_07065 [Rhodospirillales bacterium 20-60-12]HQT66796.1 DNA polymerase Y family protein [Acetobacteraceae bacterium]